MKAELASQRCIPCERGTAPLPLEQAQALLSELDGHWRLASGGRALTRQINFKNFARAVAFLNRLAEIAEREGHHPDFCVKDWNRVNLSLTTHAIDGLSRNDFVLAAKLQAVIKPLSDTSVRWPRVNRGLRVRATHSAHPRPAFAQARRFDHIMQRRRVEVTMADPWIRAVRPVAGVQARELAALLELRARDPDQVEVRGPTWSWSGPGRGAGARLCSCGHAPPVAPSVCGLLPARRQLRSGCAARVF